MDKPKVVIYVLSILLSLTCNLQAADLNDNFLGIKWGTRISELPNFTKISGKDDVAYYRNPAKTYTVFEIENPSVIHGFYKDQFFATYIQVDTYSVFERVKDQLSEKFGTPNTTLKIKSRQTIHRWKHQNIKIKLKLYEAEGTMKLAFYYMPLSDKLNAAQQETFPAVSDRIYTPDEGTRQGIRRELKMQRAIDVMDGIN